VVALRGETHGGAVGATSAGRDIEGARGVPCQTEQDRAVGAVVVVVLVDQTFGDGIVNLLVVLLLGSEDGVALHGIALSDSRVIGIVATATEQDSGESTVEQTVAAAGLGSSLGDLGLGTLGRVAAAGGLLLKDLTGRGTARDGAQR